MNRRDSLKKGLSAFLLYTFGSKLVSSCSAAPTPASIRAASHGEEYWKSIKQQFLLDDKLKYFNVAGLGSSSRQALESLQEYQLKAAKAPTSGYWHKVSKKTRATLGKFLNAPVEQLAFTRNATESMNIIAQSVQLQAGDEVILTQHEHIGGAAPWIALIEKKGIQVKLVELDLTGKNNTKRITEAVSEATKLIVFSHVTCTTGLILPVKEISAWCKQRNILTCVDGAQAVGMINVDLQDLNPSFYVGSGHKWIGGPTETGFLYVEEGLTPLLAPLFSGAYTDEIYNLNKLTLKHRHVIQRVEYGTRDAAKLAGFDAALRFLMDLEMQKVEERGKMLADYFKERLTTLSNVELLTPKANATAGAIVTFRIPGSNAPDLQKQLHDEFHCRVRAIYENDLNAIRVSLAIFNVPEEIDFLIEQIKQIS